MPTTPNDAVSRLDAFPFEYRLRDVMSSPVITIASDDTVGEAARQMIERGFSSLIVDAGDRRYGIVTERDVLKRVASGLPVRDAMIEEIASFPLITLPASAFVYRALGRANRKGIRHLGVTDEAGDLVGMISSRELLRQRASGALMLGDGVAESDSPDQMKAIHDRLPALARALLQEGVDAPAISAVISQLTADLTQRAIALAEADHPANALPRRCWLLLGSAARGESLLKPDQDNAVIWDDAATEDQIKALQSVAKRVNELLNMAGIPYCKGGVMAQEAAWQGSTADWTARIEKWVSSTSASSLLAVDIFYDARPVSGDLSLGQILMEHARKAAKASPGFLRQLSLGLEQHSAPLGLLGGFRLDEAERLDVKINGLFPIVAGARVMALSTGGQAAECLASDDRLEAASGISARDRSRLLVARRVLMSRLLIQQLEDQAAGQSLTTSILVKPLTAPQQDTLRKALKDAALLPEMARDAISA
ncbi:MAG: hypothetical protein Alpg2KO_03030 [Alphaproteobacteria bacterium]